VPLKDEVCCVTYTTSKYADIWPMYFNQLTKHKGGIKSYALSDTGSGSMYPFLEHQLIEHDDNTQYWAQYAQALDKIPEDYVIYLQDDFFLYADVNHELLQRALDFLKDSDYDYVRLIRCGYQTPLDKHVKDNFFEVDMWPHRTPSACRPPCGRSVACVISTHTSLRRSGSKASTGTLARGR
jgi:hypothetical protein